MNLENVYTYLAYSQIPRLLTLLDRNPASSTYGCFDRRFWLDKVEDFPNALPQMGVYPLAFCYKYKFSKNVFFENPVMRDWAISAISWLCKIQKEDGSFDEFYPNERGWAGPTGFILYSVIKALELLEDEIPQKLLKEFKKMVKKAAFYLAKNREIGTLANHYVLALLSLFKAKNYLGDNTFSPYLDELFYEIKKLFSDEGWFLEYDGADPGYLTATISFFSRLYQEGFHKDEIFMMLKESVRFSSYFIFPDGSYSGCIGSRSTQHFYPFGFELLSKDLNEAKVCADFMRRSLENGRGGVLPSSMADRYFVYRLVEYFDTALIFDPKKGEGHEKLPFEKETFFKFFPESGIFIKSTKDYYFVSNLKKGGVFKFCRKEKGSSICDGGICVRLKSGKVLTNQWIGNYKIEAERERISIKGNLYELKNHLFTPLRFIIFRIFCLMIGVFPGLAKSAKGLFRRILILKAPSSKIEFKRDFVLDEAEVSVEDEIRFRGIRGISEIFLGGNLNFRYVPQSRYFEDNDLFSLPISFKKSDIEKFEKTGEFRMRRRF